MAGAPISIALATFNGAAFLESQLSDLAAQSVEPSELVVCDDGSSDDTLAILERFAAHAPFPVHVHRNEQRLGYRANFMKCASACTSQFVVFCDQDDRWDASKLETMLRHFDDPDVLLVFHDAQIMDPDGTLTQRISAPRWRAGSTPPLEGPPWDHPLGFTQMFRRRLCAYDQWWTLSVDQNAPGQFLAHDQWYIFLAATLGTVVREPRMLAHYRQHSANVFGWSGSTRGLLQSRLDRAASACSRNDARVQSARQRSAILDNIASSETGKLRDRARSGADSYRRLASLCGDRVRLLSSARLAERVQALRHLLRQSAYGPGPWQFGGGALALDLSLGLPGWGRRDRARQRVEPAA